MDFSGMYTTLGKRADVKLVEKGKAVDMRSVAPGVRAIWWKCGSIKIAIGDKIFCINKKIQKQGIKMQEEIMQARPGWL